MTRVQDWQREAWANGPLGGTPITAERLNNIEEGIEALQEAAAEPPEPVAPGLYRGVWSASPADPYIAEQAVTHNGMLYRSTADNNTTTPGQPNATWTPLLVIPRGGGFLGDWTPGTYNKNEQLAYNGKVYAVKANSTSATPTMPESLPSTPVGGEAWSANNAISVAPDVVTLSDGSGPNASTLISKEAFTDFRGLELFFDIRNDKVQNANIQIAIVPDTLPAATCGGNALRGIAGVWGFFMETGGGYMPMTNGNVNGGAGANPTTAGAVVRFSLKFTNTRMEIYRAGNLIHGVDSVPPYTAFRLAVGAQYAGTVTVNGSPGTAPGVVSPDWRAISKIP